MTTQQLQLCVTLVIGLIIATSSARVPIDSQEDIVDPNPEERLEPEQQPFVKDGSQKSHPLADHIHPDDETAQLKPLHPHKLNDMKLVKDHTKVVMKMAQERGGANAKEIVTHLLDHMTQYKKAHADHEAYMKNRQFLPAEEQARGDLRLQSKARALHQKFYNLKMEVIKLQPKELDVEGEGTNGKRKTPYDMLRKMLKSDAFSNDDRKNFEAEISHHEELQEAFRRSQDAHHNQLRKMAEEGKDREEVIERHRMLSRDKVKTHQLKHKKKFAELRQRIFKQHENGKNEDL